VQGTLSESFSRRLNNFFHNNHLEIDTRTNAPWKFMIVSFSLFLVTVSFFPTTANASTAGQGIDWINLCQNLQVALVSSCNQLVTPNNVLTSEGERALGCIRNGILLGGGGTFLLSLPLEAIIPILRGISEPTGCGGIVQWDLMGDVPNLPGVITMLTRSQTPTTGTDQAPTMGTDATNATGGASVSGPSGGVSQAVVEVKKPQETQHEHRTEREPLNLLQDTFVK
jgi:hypothetical protein